MLPRTAPSTAVEIPCEVTAAGAAEEVVPGVPDKRGTMSVALV